MTVGQIAPSDLCNEAFRTVNRHTFLLQKCIFRNGIFPLKKNLYPVELKIL